ncbi:unnamed protein product [Vitrella brassicaformis CCMP3155]|uniref:Choline transporter-like protein n=1 Tax=Vitrella brassicaformis (strain CCMP3155) TaxID=1169540 RepID=A0A0G4EHP5_VITBC|nr:unnamed protein product [Vitrella brassicaformis CCMP3155]|eukprot:CEL95710.1 unnamed protein product [Vitrella brassicaformis CCMP3155]
MYQSVDKKQRILYERSCTDCFCCLLFTAFLGGMIFVGVIALQEGNPHRLYRGYNYNGRLCGEGTLEGRPLLFWPIAPLEVLANITTTEKFVRLDVVNSTSPPDYTPGTVLGTYAGFIDPSTPICVKKCPSALNVVNNDTVRYPMRHTTTGEVAETDPSRDTVSETTTLTYVDTPVYATTKLMHAYCLPTNATVAKDLIARIGLDSHTQQFQRAIGSLEEGWPFVLIGAVCALLGGFLYLLLLSCCAAPMVWIATVMIPVSMLGMGAYLTYSGFVEQSDYLVNTFGEDSSEWTKWVGVALMVAGVLFSMLICCACDSINIAIGVIEAAVECLFDIPKMLTTPLFGFVSQGLAYLMLCVGLVYIVSSGTMESKTITALGTGSNAPDAIPIQGIHRHFHLDDRLTGFALYWFFGGLWVVEFMAAFWQFVASYGVALWYFTLPEPGSNDRSVSCPIYYGVKAAAFIKYLLEIVKKRIQSATGGENGVVSCLIRCMQGCISCFQWCAEYVNSNAYIECVINSVSFCPAAAQAVARLIKAAPAVVFLNGFSKIFSLLGVLSIGLSTSWGMYALMTTVKPFNDPADDWFVESPLVVGAFVLIIALSLSSLVMLVFDQTADTIFYCFLVERDENNSEVYAPNRLRTLLADQSGKQMQIAQERAENAKMREMDRMTYI